MSDIIKDYTNIKSCAIQHLQDQRVARHNFREMRMPYLMHIFEHPEVSEKDVIINFVTWYPVLLFPPQLIFHFHHYLCYKYTHTHARTHARTTHAMLMMMMMMMIIIICCSLGIHAGCCPLIVKCNVPLCSVCLIMKLSRSSNAWCHSFYCTL